MRTLRDFLRTFRRDDRGQDLIEYAMLAGLIALSSSALFPGLGDNVRSVYGRAAAALKQTSDSAQATMIRSADGPIVVLEKKRSDDESLPALHR